MLMTFDIFLYVLKLTWRQVMIRNPPLAPDTAGLVIDSTSDATVQLLDVSTGKCPTHHLEREAACMVHLHAEKRNP